jgi:hypothetical protein
MNTVTANAAIVPAGNDGSIAAFASGATDLVIDMNGYFAPPPSRGLSLSNVAPCRVLDTREPAGAPAVNGVLDIQVATPTCGISTAAPDGAITTKSAIVPATNGWISALFSSPSHLVVDISGYFGQ